MQKGIVIIFVLIVIVYVLTNKKRIDKQDLALLVVSIIALTWKYFSHQNALERFQEAPESLVNILNTLKPIEEEEDYLPISKNLLMYYTSFNSLSYTPNTKTWRNILDTQTNKQGIIKCNTEMIFDLLPNFNKVDGFTLGPNKLTGPYSNTLGINFRSQFTIMLAFKHGNLKNDVTQGNVIELVKLWANSPNNNGVTLFIEPGSLDVVNNTQFGKLMIQYADYSPIHCKISADDDLIPIENNVLCFLFIVKYDDKLRLLYMTEKNNNVTTLAEFNIANSEITFSNKEIYVNRFNNWNSNIYNFAIYKTALTDTTITSVYQHIKSLYTKYNDPNYKPIVDTYNETLDKLSKYIKCPFDAETCKSCGDVKEWNDVTQVINAPLECRKSIGNFCKKNTSHSFCQCWDTTSEISKTTSCKMIRAMFETDDAKVLTKEQIANLTKKCEKAAEKYDGLNYDGEYTFDKVRVKYDDSLTTQERIGLGKMVEKPDFMTASDYQSDLSASALRLTDKEDAPTKKVPLSTEDELLMKEIITTDEDIKLNKKTDGGLWSMLKIFK